MGLNHVRYRSLRELLAHELIRDEEPATAEVVRHLRHVKRRGWFSRREFLAMCRWKSPRAIRHYEQNSSATIRELSRAVLATRSERRRLALLTSLPGVSVPIASAILTLTDPRRYGVIDIRVWQLLFAIKSVGKNPHGRAFTFEHWDDFLRTLRHHARELDVPVRAVEYTLFECHKRLQRGTLYAARVGTRRGVRRKKLSTPARRRGSRRARGAACRVR